jgi:hypothetical protein
MYVFYYVVNGKEYFTCCRGAIPTKNSPAWESPSASVWLHKQGGSVMRGYACIALHRPKTTINVGSAMRAAYVYDAPDRDERSPLLAGSCRHHEGVPAHSLPAGRRRFRGGSVTTASPSPSIWLTRRARFLATATLSARSTSLAQRMERSATTSSHAAETRSWCQRASA